MHATDAQRGLLRLAGGLLIAGFALFGLITPLFHPKHDENNHPLIFGKYDDSQAWVAVHMGQFVAVLIALGGFIVLHRFLETRGKDVVLARLAFAATIATAAVWAVLQAVDGTALKEATDAWGTATGADKALRFADAETVRWTEWGLQSYMRVLLGATLLLFGAAILTTHLLGAWTGWIAALAGVLSLAVGVDVSYSGLDSGFQQIASPAFQVLMLAFAIGVVVAAARGRVSESPRR
jgi:hypothetical protein